MQSCLSYKKLKAEVKQWVYYITCSASKTWLHARITRGALKIVPLPRLHPLTN